MPNQGVPVIFKNKIAYGYAEQSVKAYDVSVSDYNALTEAQQLDGSIRLIQGVDATPNGSNIWAKIGTTPLAEGLPRDCSQAINQLKSNLTHYLPAKIISASVPNNTTETKIIDDNTLYGNYVIVGYCVFYNNLYFTWVNDTSIRNMRIKTDGVYIVMNTPLADATIYITFGAIS